MPMIPPELDWFVISMAAAIVAIAVVWTRHFREKRRTD
jgi:bacteriorhodopsin